MTLPPPSAIRVDLRMIADLIGPGSRVLDVGCGDGTLLALLREEKRVDGRGMELSMEGVRAAVTNGLSVIQGNADTDLRAYPTDAFDYVILSQTLPAMLHPREVLEHLLRIGRWALVSFPNFGHWTLRTALFLKGQMPVTPLLPYQWYETPNIHLCTVRDFVELCDTLRVEIHRALILGADGQVITTNARGRRANLLGQQAIFLLHRP